MEYLMLRNSMWWQQSGLSMRWELSSLENSGSHSTRTQSQARWNQLLFAKSRGGSLDLMQTHSGPSVFLVSFCKDLARTVGTPQSNQKWPLAWESNPVLSTYRPNHWTIPDPYSNNYTILYINSIYCCLFCAWEKLSLWGCT